MRENVKVRTHPLLLRSLLLTLTQGVHQGGQESHSRKWNELGRISCPRAQRYSGSTGCQCSHVPSPELRHGQEDLELA